MALTIVQSASISEATGPATILVMPGSVTSGNLLVVMTGHPGGNECTGGTVAVYTDTRSLTFTAQITAENPGGNQSNSCIITAPITSSGAETITRTIIGSNYPVAMWAAEIGGLSAFSVDATNTAIQDLGTSINTGNVVSANTDLLLLGVGSDSNPATSFDSSSPSGATTAYVNYAGAFLAKLVGAGTYSCTFGKSGADKDIHAPQHCYRSLFPHPLPNLRYLL